MNRFSDEDIQWVLDLVADEQLAEIEVEDGECAISVKAFGAEAPQQLALAQPTPPPLTDDSQELPDHMMPVLAPVTGTFYAAPSPDAKPYVGVGDVVEVGDTVGLIEAMKLYHDVTAPVRGTIAAIRVDNADYVEAEQPLFIINRTT